MSVQANVRDSLLATIIANNYKETKKLLNNNRDLILDDNFSDYKLLILALHHGRMKIAKLLLDHGCRVFCQQSTAYGTPLYYAAIFNCLELVKILLQKGASINGKDGNKETPLCVAMKYKYFKCVDLILSKYTIKKLDINEDEVNHFHIAVMRDKTKLVNTFLEYGMPVNQSSKSESSVSQGNTPLHLAVENNSLETVKLLLSKKANFGLKNAQGLTPLHVAFYLENCMKKDEIMNLILSAHLKTMVNPTDNNGVSHFHIACSKSNLKLLKLFLKSGADCNSCVSSKSSVLPGYAPLHIAVKYHCKKTIQFLLDHKAEINKTTYMGITPLHLAVESDNIEIVQLLIKCNADVLAVDNDKNTAIHTAFEGSEVNGLSQSKRTIINLLFLTCKGNLKNVSNKKGLTLFHIACATTSNPELIKNFLKHNVNVNACVKENVKGWAGYSALHFAIANGNSEIIQILLEKNVGLKMVNTDKHPPLYWVCKLWIVDAMDAINISYEKSPTKALEDEDFRNDLSNKLSSINENGYQGLKLFLKKKEMYELIMFDVFEIIFNLFIEIYATSEMYQGMNELKINQLVATFKTIMINLIEHGYNINKKNSNRQNISILFCLINLLMMCYNESIIEMIESLLIQGAQVDIELDNGDTPLMAAARYGLFEVVDVLLKYKANPNKYSKTYDTPLHHVLKEGISDDLNLNISNLFLETFNNAANKITEDIKRHKVLLSLLQHNCEVNSKNSLGHTALHLACINRNLPALTTLLYYGADINLVDSINMTPLELMFQRFQSIAFLLENCEMLKILELHVLKLNFIGFDVSQKNSLACEKIKSFSMMNEMDVIGFLFADQQPTQECTMINENKVFIDFCDRELRRMKRIKIDKYTSLYDILFKSAHEVSKCINSEFFKEIVNSSELEENFPLYGYILNLQYKKGLERYKLLKPASEVLEAIFDLPGLVYDRILVSFTDRELENLYNQAKNQ